MDSESVRPFPGIAFLTMSAAKPEQVTALRIEFDWLDDEVTTTTTQLDRICRQGVLHGKLYRKVLRERKCAFGSFVIMFRSLHKVSITATVWIGTITATATASVRVIITTLGGSGREGTLELTTPQCGVRINVVDPF